MNWTDYWYCVGAAALIGVPLVIGFAGLFMVIDAEYGERDRRTIGTGMIAFGLVFFLGGMFALTPAQENRPANKPVQVEVRK